MDKIKVLIVDDSTAVLESLESFLKEKEDIEVVGTAENGVEALDALRTQAVDVMLLDMVMPKLDGFGVLAELKRMSTVKRPHIIAITALVRDDFIQRAEIRLVDNLAAPISLGEIVGTFSYTARDGEVITASLIAGRDIAAQPERLTIYDLFPFLHIFDNPLVSLLAIVLVLLILMVILYNNAKRRRKERRRRELYEQRRREYLRRQQAAQNGRQPSASRSSSTRRPTQPVNRTRAQTGSSRNGRKIHNDDLF